MSCLMTSKEQESCVLIACDQLHVHSNILRKPSVVVSYAAACKLMPWKQLLVINTQGRVGFCLLKPNTCSSWLNS